MSNPNIVFIGLALNENINHSAFLLIKKLTYFINSFLKMDVIIVSPINLQLPHINTKIIYYNDNDELFDFSRYNQILLILKDYEDNIIFTFNDTLGSGRKNNFGLFLYIILSIFLLHKIEFKFPKIFAPLDKDKYNNYWICPYFLISKVNSLKLLNFVDWKVASKKLPKSVKIDLIIWINNYWRRAFNSTSKQKRIKYKTLILERSLIKNKIIDLNFMYSRKNIFRIINKFL